MRGRIAAKFGWLGRAGGAEVSRSTGWSDDRRRGLGGLREVVDLRWRGRCEAGVLRQWGATKGETLAFWE